MIDFNKHKRWKRLSGHGDTVTVDWWIRRLNLTGDDLYEVCILDSDGTVSGHFKGTEELWCRMFARCPEGSVNPPSDREQVHFFSRLGEIAQGRLVAVKAGEEEKDE